MFHLCVFKFLKRLLFYGYVTNIKPFFLYNLQTISETLIKVMLVKCSISETLIKFYILVKCCLSWEPNLTTPGSIWFNFIN